MMQETSPNGYQEPADATVAMADDLGHLGSDLLELAELQAELFRIEAGEAASRAVLPGALAVLAVAFVIGACPLAMLGLAWALAAWTTLTAATSALLVAAGGLLLAAVLGWLAIVGFRRCAEAMHGSVAECRRNLGWVKSLLKRERRYRASARRGMR